MHRPVRQRTPRFRDAIDSAPRMARALPTAMLVTALLCTSSCGTLLYPERHGQSHGRIDPGVAILDGVGLLLFVVPGLVAFGVDFATGAIYLPSRRTASRDRESADRLALDTGDRIDPAASYESEVTVVLTASPFPTQDVLEATLAREVGYELDLSREAFTYRIADAESVSSECRRLVTLGLL
jgi:hypothetical protein